MEVIRVYHDELNLSSSQITERIMARFSLDQSETERYVEEALSSAVESELT